MSSKDWYSATPLLMMLVLASMAGAHACASPPPTTSTGEERPPGEPGPLNLGPGENGLPARSLLSNAVTLNPKALRILMRSPLNDALFDPRKHRYMSLQLTDARARDVMEYVVSCALGRSEQVRYTDATTHAAQVWQGEMGLCPTWSKQAPSRECLHRVSSCLFARTNRLGRQVPVRFAGLQFRPRTRVEIMMKPVKPEQGAGARPDTELIPPFSRGWKPGYLGLCVPREPITLWMDESSRCARTPLRVCKGLRGCEPDDPAVLGAGPGACRDAPLTFTCPEGGHYGVMTRPDPPRAVEVVQRRSDAGSYPAPEEDVFPHLEGAFFGNLFDPDGLTRYREVVEEGNPPLPIVIGGQLAGTDEIDEESIPHRRIYSCYSLENAEEGVAYLNGRICAKPDAKKKCFPNPPQACRFQDAGEDAGRDAVCRRRPDGRLECKGDDGILYPALAVFLAEPCGFTDTGCANLPVIPREPAFRSRSPIVQMR